MKKQKQKQDNIDIAVTNAVAAYRETGNDTDPDGMYTGVTVANEPPCPVQDADDL